MDTTVQQGTSYYWCDGIKENAWEISGMHKTILAEKPECKMP
jgi:hypothetical protein